MALELVYESQDAIPEAVKSMYVEHEGKFRLDVNGIEDTRGLKSALEKERQAAKDAKSELAKYAGQDEKIKKALEFYETSEEAKMTQDEIINKRVAKREEDVARKLEEKDAEVKLARELAVKNSRRLLHADIRAVAPTDLAPSALEDALRHAESVFELDEEGKTVPKDGKFGKDGKKPYDPAEWFADTRVTHPHRFLNGNSGSSAAGKGAKPAAKDLSHLNPAERMTAARAQQNGNRK